MLDIEVESEEVLDVYNESLEDKNFRNRWLQHMSLIVYIVSVKSILSTAHFFPIHHILFHLGRLLF